MNFDKIGEMALGSRLRFLSSKVTEDSEQIYDAYGTELKPKWFPVFYFLSDLDEAKSITSIATAVGHSHPSVIKIVKEMSKAKLAIEQGDPLDGRKNNVRLTEKGKEIAVKMNDSYTDVESAIKKMLGQTRHNIWSAMQEFEYLLEEESLLSRVLREKKERESSNVQILHYRPEDRSAFRELNEQWITKYFRLEDADRKALEDPQGYILDRGGKILVAVQNGTVLGVCALLKMQDGRYDYELAKMAVSPGARGKGIGHLIGKSIIEKAKELDASYLYLESNTILRPAISLYEKLGFKKVLGHHTPYERCNIQMELRLK